MSSTVLICYVYHSSSLHQLRHAELQCSASRNSQPTPGWPSVYANCRLLSVKHCGQKVSCEDISCETLEHSSQTARCHPWGGCWSSAGMQGVCMRDMFILNEIWRQDTIHILVRTLLGWYILLVTSVPVLAPNYKQYILSPAKVRPDVLFISWTLSILFIWIYLGKGGKKLV
jgi:hypothetical protein